MRDQNACATGASVARRTGCATAHISECASTAALDNEQTLGQTYRQRTVDLFARIANDRDGDLRSHPHTHKRLLVGRLTHISSVTLRPQHWRLPTPNTFAWPPRFLAIGHSRQPSVSTNRQNP